MTTTSLHRRLSAALLREDGMALVLALGISAVFAIVGTTVMFYSSHNSVLASRSTADQRAFALAEAGINNAASVIYHADNALTNTILPHSLATANVDQQDGGVVKWWGNLNGTTWTLNSFGYMRNPTGPGMGDLVRRITTTLHVRPSFMQPPNSMAWNYIIATRTGTPGGCDLSLNNNMNMQSSLYVMGNLCLNTPSQITQGIDPTMIVVKGSVDLAVNTNIGVSGTPIGEAHIAGTCTYKGKTYACSDSSNAHIWASHLDNVPPPLTPPTADFAGWYAAAVPGPNQGCTTSSGTVPIFDNNGVREPAINGSVPGVFNLTPSGSDYSCIVAFGGHTAGQLTWDHTSKTLTVYGTIYIDGSACICGAGTVQYNGQASLYLSGTFQVMNSNFCGAISGSTCAWSNPPSGWDPNNEMFMVVADGQGGQNPAGDSVQIKNSYFQGGLYTTYAIELDTTSQTEGPMIASTEILGQTVVGHAWTTITSVPAGAPGTPTVYAQPDPPTNFQG